jgi:predicted 3-demethylubiquinone-9 3-methyltransferase (glyoxalase superfamily)
MTKNDIYPCLWFDINAKDVAVYYCDIFKNGKLLSENSITSYFEIMGTKFLALNGGKTFKVNQAISYYVYCNGNDEISRLYDKLSEGGKILMPLNTYPWSNKYAWIADKYGVNWQLDIANIESEQKILPSMLFANAKMNSVREAINQYLSIFPNSKLILESPCPPEMNMAKAILFAQYSLSGFLFNSMSSNFNHAFDFTPGNSFVIECENQEEIDFYWEKLGEEGFYSQCGWLQDKCGISWQIVPKILSKLMSDPAKAPKVVEAYMKMQKFIIDDLVKD